MKITIEREVKTIQEAHDFIRSLLPEMRAEEARPKRVVTRAVSLTTPVISEVRNFEANKEILKYVRDAGRKGRTTTDMERDLANLGVGKNPAYFSQKANKLMRKKRLVRITGPDGRYIYMMPYFRKEAAKARKRPAAVPPTAAIVKHAQKGHSGAKEVAAAAQLILEDRKGKGALFGEIKDLVRPSLRLFSPNYASAMVSFMKKKGVIVARRERVEGAPNKFRYYLPEYAPEARA